MSTQRDRPYPGFNFQVDLGDGVQAGFAEISGLSASVDVIEYREGADKSLNARKLPGLNRTASITLRRGIAGSVNLFQWFHGNISGTPDRRNITITLLDEARMPVMTWKLSNAWPQKYEAGSLNAKGTEVAIELLELTYEQLEVE